MGLHLYPISFLCSPLFLWGYEVILPKHGCHFKQLLIKAKVLNILMNCYYLQGGPPCIYSPNMSSKFHHLNPKQPSDRLPFLHYELVTEHSFRIEGNLLSISGSYAGALTPHSALCSSYDKIINQTQTTVSTRSQSRNEPRSIAATENCFHIRFLPRTIRDVNN